MSHLAPQAAIFSPSIARAAASTAKDWAYVDSWLKRQYANLARNKNNSSSHVTSKPPTFERNNETLEALLALIALNEAADEERDRLASLESQALDEIRAFEEEKNSRRQQSNPNSNQDKNPKTENGEEKEEEEEESQQVIHGDLLAEDLLQSIDANLTKEGLTALDAMADVAMALDMAADPNPALLGHRFVELQGRAHETDQLLHRVKLLQSYLDEEAARLSLFVEELKLGRQYELPPDVASENDHRERTVKSMSAKLPDLQRQVEALEKKVGIPPLTVDEVRRDEAAYLTLLAKKKHLDAQVRAFAGLPPDVEAARLELEGLRLQLREATERRDANFEMLVERESPVKVRTSRRF